MQHSKGSQELLDAIGNTPLIRLRGPSEATGCDIYGKAEFMNPGGSVKDRAALAIIEDAEALPIIYDLMRDEGLYLGGSTAINIAGAMAMARDMGPGHTIVTILCDSGQRYQSKVWNPAFLREKNLPVPSWLEE